MSVRERERESAFWSTLSYMTVCLCESSCVCGDIFLCFLEDAGIEYSNSHNVCIVSLFVLQSRLRHSDRVCYVSTSEGGNGGLAGHYVPMLPMKWSVVVVKGMHNMLVVWNPT